MTLRKGSWGTCLEPSFMVLRIHVTSQLVCQHRQGLCQPSHLVNLFDMQTISDMMGFPKLCALAGCNGLLAPQPTSLAISLHVQGCPPSWCKSQEGDQVKAIAGVHQGQTGLVLAMDSDTGIAVVLSDATREELKVLSRHLTRSTETTSTLDTCAPPALC